MEKITTAVVPDEVFDIQAKLVEWSSGDEPAHLIITTGGTGFSVRIVSALGIAAIVWLLCMPSATAADDASDDASYHASDDASDDDSDDDSDDASDYAAVVFVVLAAP